MRRGRRARHVWRWLPAVPVALAIAGTGIVVSAGAPGAEAQDDLTDTGRALFERQCSSCHGLDGTGVDGRGPSLEHEGEASADFVLRTGRMPLADPVMQANRGPVRYSEDQILAMVAFVGSIGDGPDIPDVDPERGDLTAGGRLYRLNCAACHVASGAGAPIGGARFAPSLADSTPTQIGQAIIVGPGAMPNFGTFDSDDLDDVAAYVDVALQQEDTTSARRFGGAGPVAEGLAAWVLALLPLVALTRWIGRPKEGRDRPLVPTALSELDTSGPEPEGHPT